LPFNTCPLIDRFLGVIAREQTDRFRPATRPKQTFSLMVKSLGTSASRPHAALDLKRTEKTAPPVAGDR
jgi:hypothetical protein